MASSEMTNFYEVLGVSPNATPKDINNAYKRLALKHHPDKVSGGDIDEFHKIQEAAETLRDPDRRRRHDYDIKAFRIRNYYKVFGQSLNRSNNNSNANANNYNSFNYSNYEYSQQYPQRPFYSRCMPSSFESYNMNTSGYTYMYSYKHSVHMSPTSRESTEEQERYMRDRCRDEEVRRNMFHRTGEDPGSSKPGSKEPLDARAARVRLQEAMKARVARDEEELKNEEEMGADEQDDEDISQEVTSGDESESEEEDVEDLSDTEPVSGPAGAFENEGENRSSPIPSVAAFEEDGCQEENGETKNSLRPGSSLFGQSEYSTAREESESSDYEGEPTYEDDAVFYDCIDVESSYLSETSDASEDVSNEASESDDSEDDSEPMSPTLLTPFIPHFMSKLNDPNGKYTEDDLRVELHGMMMESYCVWLEDVRLSFTNAQLASSARDNDPETCLHLGYWEKRFEVLECRECRRWRPIYTLTCPGCGVSHCVGCKFSAGKV